MDELVTWLRGVLDAIEGAAQAACEGNRTTLGAQWSHRGREGDTAMVRDGDGLVVVYDEGEPDDAQATHIALHDPRAALARVEAERAIVEEYERYRDQLTADTRVALNAVIWMLAHGHRHDADGWDPAWTPEGVPGGATAGR